MEEKTIEQRVDDIIAQIRLLLTGEFAAFQSEIDNLRQRISDLEKGAGA